MPGLNLGARGGVSASVGTPKPNTATEAAFGQGYTSSDTPSTWNAVTPNDPFGVAFTAGLLSLAILFVIRHSLPS